MDVKSAFLYGKIIEEVYVDDIIFGSNKKELSTEFEKMMHDKFQMSSMGELTLFLGLQFQQKHDGIFINQDKYVAEILKKFDFANVKTASTSIKRILHEINKQSIDTKCVDVHLYRSMIRSLMYLIAFRPDIMFAVCVCARFQVTPKTSHLHAVKRIFRYLKGGYQFLGKRLISWQCKKQIIVANSTTEVEYVAAANCCGQNPVFHFKTKHIEIKHHFIRDSYEKRLIQVIKIHTDYNVTDLLTKAFDVGDEAVHKELGDRMERAATTASSLEAKQDSENEEIEITSTIDGRVKTITQASIRRHLKLEDVAGISSLLNTKFFEQLALMSPKKTAWEQFSSNIAIAIICLATNRTFNFSKMIFEEMVKNLDSRTYVAPTLTQKLFSNMRRVSKGYTREDIPLFLTMLTTPESSPSRIKSSPSLSLQTHPSTSQQPPTPPFMQTIHDAEEPASMPHDSSQPRVQSLGSDEGSLPLNELTVLCITLSNKVMDLQNDLKQTKLTYGAA
ncbi:putative ribonuclease H-like domain-containing protein, partial [Tanacetum coccineum]